jgi:shikimate kinase
MENADPCAESPPAAGTNRCDPLPGSIFLVGMMGAGKTSVGRLLAQRLGKRFIDADHEIEARCGVTIPVIFEIEGEAGFRQRERAVIDELTRLPGIVLATGGGAVLARESREYLHGRGLVVYLKASAAEIWHRTRRDRSRPLLATADPQRRIADLLAEREPLYAEVAHLTIESTHESVKSLVGRLVDALTRETGDSHALEQPAPPDTDSGAPGTAPASPAPSVLASSAVPASR